MTIIVHVEDEVKKPYIRNTRVARPVSPQVTTAGVIDSSIPIRTPAPPSAPRRHAENRRGPALRATWLRSEVLSQFFSDPKSVGAEAVGRAVRPDRAS
eukprot:4475415-Prymnesium_polylepis.1